MDKKEQPKTEVKDEQEKIDFDRVRQQMEDAEKLRHGLAEGDEIAHAKFAKDKKAALETANEDEEEKIRQEVELLEVVEE